MELKKICDRCGAAFDADSVYCKYCGVKRGIAEDGENSGTDEARNTPKRIGYCKYCRKRLRRNEICDCARSVEENKRQQKKKKEAAPDQQKEARQTKTRPIPAKPPVTEPATESQPVAGMESVKPPVTELAGQQTVSSGQPALQPASSGQSKAEPVFGEEFTSGSVWTELAGSGTMARKQKAPERAGSKPVFGKQDEAGSTPPGQAELEPEPVSDKPTVEQSVEQSAAKPSSDSQGGSEPISPEPSSDNQAGNKPISPEPSSDNQAGNKPISPEPSSDNQAGNKPISPEPSSDSQVGNKPISSEPSSDSQVGSKPISPKPSPGKQAGLEPVPSEKPADKRTTSENPPKKSFFKWIVLAIVLLAIAAVVLACTWKGPDGGTAMESIISQIEGFFGGNESSGGVIKVDGGPDSVPQESTGDQEVPEEDTPSGTEGGSESGDETPVESPIKPANETFMDAKEAAEAVSLLMDDYRMNSISKEELQTSMEEIREKAEMDEGILEEFEVEIERISASHDAYYNGVENEKNGLYIEAITCFQQVEADDGFYEEAMRKLGECETKYVLLVISSADGAVTGERISEAESILESALAIFPQNQSLIDKLAEVQALEPHLITDSDISDYSNLFATRAQGADSGDAVETGTYILRSNAGSDQEAYFVVAASGKYGSISGTVMISSTSEQIAPGEGGWMEIWADYLGDGNYERIYASPNELNQTTTAYGFGVDISGSQSVMLRLERTEMAQGTLDMRLEALTLDSTTESVLDGYSSEPPVIEQAAAVGDGAPTREGQLTQISGTGSADLSGAADIFRSGGAAWSGYILDATNKVEYDIGDCDISMPASALIGVPILFTVADGYEKGQITDDSTAEFRFTYQDGRGDLKAEQDGGSFPVIYLLQEALVYSDNNAMNSLIDYLTLDKINQVCQSYGYSSVNLERKIISGETPLDNYISAKDICLMLNAVYQNNFERVNRDFLLEYFKITNADTTNTGMALEGRYHSIFLNLNGITKERYNEVGLFVDGDNVVIMAAFTCDGDGEKSINTVSSFASYAGSRVF